MRVRLDEDRCCGHGRCYDVAPEVFAARDDDGHAVLLAPGDLPVDLIDAARRAAANCPERAVTLED